MTKASSLDTTAQLTEAAIAKYLENEPDFFQRHSHLLTRIKIEHKERGAISLVEIQLSRLREKVAELEEEITQLMSVAISNEKLYTAISNAHKKLFAAKNKKAIYQVLNELGDQLNLQVDLRLYDQKDRRLAKLDVKRIKAAYFAGQSKYLGRLRKADGEVFLKNAPELGSYLLLPLFVDDKERGFLAFASQEGGHFQPSMDTLFVEQLAAHIAISIEQMGK